MLFCRVVPRADRLAWATGRGGGDTHLSVAGSRQQGRLSSFVFTLTCGDPAPSTLICQL